MSVRKAQTDFFSPMTGNVFRDNRRRADLIMDAAKVQMIKTDDPFTQVKEKRRYYSPDDTRSITDAFDRDYGVLSDEEAATILEQNQEAIQQPTPVINPEPTPTPTEDPAPTENPILEIVEAVLDKSQISPTRTSGRKSRSNYKDPRRVANRNKAKAMAKARKASSSSSRSSTSSSSSSAGRSGVGRGGARGGSTGGRGASSKGGVSRGSRSGSPSRGGARGGSTGGRGASSRGGVSRGSRRGGVGRGGRRGGRRCDIRCKFDISLLSNMNLIRDDLAELAYFVKEISN